jgi:hypothetical protein
MRDRVVVSLCDLTGNFTRPWQEAGYKVILVDPQHGRDSSLSPRDGRGAIAKWATTVERSLRLLGPLMREGRIAFVAAFPPCTDMAVSGARWFKDKHAADPLFQAKAVAVAEQCRTIGRLSGAPWFVENPVSILSSVFGKPDHTFDPYQFTGYEPADNYRKKTCLWAGGGFRMPPPLRDESLGDPDDRIHKAAPGPDRANFRSATPMGFARAVFASNRDNVRGVA